MGAMKEERTEIDPPAATPCAACPWRTGNHRKPHPQGYNSDANRRRLWSGLRTGEAPGMTCHPTDPENQPVKETVRTRECTGAWLLLLREMAALEASAGLADYRRGRKLAVTETASSRSWRRSCRSRWAEASRARCSPRPMRSRSAWAPDDNSAHKIKCGSPHSSSEGLCTSPGLERRLSHTGRGRGS